MKDPLGITGPKSALKTRLTYNDCFVHPIFSSFGFWYYFGHFSCVIFFPFFPSQEIITKCLKQFDTGLFEEIIGNAS